jgi:hypothetical protein
VSATDNGSGPGLYERLRRALRGDGKLPIGEALHPATIAAVALLILNDWVIKPRARTGWTHAIAGKLSDIAGLAAAPVILTALIGLVLWLLRRPSPHLTRRRLVLAMTATAAGFAAIKLSPTAAAWFVDTLSAFRPAQVMLDRTDLLCLPALAIAWWIGRDELRRR